MKRKTGLPSFDKYHEYISKNIDKLSYYNLESFIGDAKEYVKAIKERRMLCVIHSVSSSGMSRNLSFHSCEKSNQKGQFYYRQYWSFFKALGYTEAKQGFRVNGCGMDMIFHTNYSNIHALQGINLISKDECKTLAQQTPTNLS